MRRAPTYEEFVEAYPAFGSTPLPLVEGALSLSTRLLDVAAWDDFLSDAIGLDAAHNLAMDALMGNTPTGAFKGAAGPITSVSAAGVSTSFASIEHNSSDKSEAWYIKTTYGQRFLRLRAVVIGPMVMSA